MEHTPLELSLEHKNMHACVFMCVYVCAGAMESWDRVAFQTE